MGTTEIVFILVVYLLLFGAKGMPSLARSLGSAVRQFRSATDEIQREILQTGRTGTGTGTGTGGARGAQTGTGGEKREAGGEKREAGGEKREAGGEKREAGGEKRETGTEDQNSEA